MIKRIACDLDGTLLNASHILDETTMALIKQLQKAGIVFMPATGRHYDSVKRLFDQCPILDEMILLNGALVTDFAGNRLQSNAMDYEQVEAVVALFKACGMSYHLYTDQGMAVTNRLRSMQEFRAHLMEHGETQKQVDMMIEAGGFFVNVIEFGDDPEAFLQTKPLVYKMETQGKDQALLAHIRKELTQIQGIEITNSIGDNVEVTHRLAQKGHALLRLCEEKQLHPDEILVIGDSMNDLSMIKNFKHSVAMQNAIPEIKQHASYITKKTYHEQGVHECFQDVLRTVMHKSL